MIKPNLSVMKKLLLIILLIVGCKETVAPLTIHGCLDSQACNYDADATICPAPTNWTSLRVSIVS